MYEKNIPGRKQQPLQIKRQSTMSPEDILEPSQAEICITQWEHTLKSPDQNKQIHVVQPCQMEHFKGTL